MRIKVEKRHIESPIRPGKRVTDCPVACAIKEAINSNWTVIVGYTGIDLVNNVSGPRHLFMPHGVFQNIMQFDNTGEMEPFEFELDYEVS